MILVIKYPTYKCLGITSYFSAPVFILLAAIVLEMVYIYIIGKAVSEQHSLSSGAGAEGQQEGQGGISRLETEKS